MKYIILSGVQYIRGLSKVQCTYIIPCGKPPVFRIKNFPPHMLLIHNFDKSNNVFREILKCFRKTAKFEFFAKQIIYLESPDHPLQNDV